MLGYTQSNNDLYIFFEDDEIERLEKEEIQGTYFNLRDPKISGLLKASIDDKISEKIDTEAEKNDDGFIVYLHLKMKARTYSKLKELRTAGSHDGYRHIELLDSNHLNFNDESNYKQLKH